MLDLADAGRLTTKRIPTLTQWLETYFSEVAAAKVRSSTLHRYREEAEHHIVPLLGRHRIDKLTPLHLTAFYRDRLQVLSPGSVRRMHASLRRALNVAVQWQLISVNPVGLVDPPPILHSEVVPFTLAEARTFLRAVEGHRMEARWQIAVTLGLRQGEVLGLRWEDIDLPAATIRVRAQLQRDQTTGELRRVETKTARSRRTLPLPRPVVAALEKPVSDKRPIAQPLIAGRKHGWVFSTAHGTAVHPRNDYRSFRRIIKRAGLRQVRLQTCGTQRPAFFSRKAYRLG